MHTTSCCCLVECAGSCTGLTMHMESEIILRYVVPRPFGVFLANLNCSNISTYAIPGIPIDQQCKNFPRLCELPYNNTGTEDVVSWHLQVVFITMHMLLS